MPPEDQVSRQEFVPINCSRNTGMMSQSRPDINRASPSAVLVTGEAIATCKTSSKKSVSTACNKPLYDRGSGRTVMTAIYPPHILDEMKDPGLVSVTDERRIGLSQHRFFCECGNVITAPSASAYIEPGGIRHVWVCDSCRQTFETSIARVDEADS